MSNETGAPVALDSQADTVESMHAIDDRRHSFRMNSETRAVLRFKRHEFVVELGDLSRGGFQVWLDEAPPFKVNQSILLRSGRGWSKVRVAYVDQVDARYRVGLEFLEDLDDPRNGTKRFLGFGIKWQQAQGGADWVFLFGILFFATLGGGLVVAHVLFPDLDWWTYSGRFREAAVELWHWATPW